MQKMENINIDSLKEYLENKKEEFRKLEKAKKANQSKIKHNNQTYLYDKETGELIEDYVEESEKDWSPIKLEDYTVPEFKITKSTGKGSEIKHRLVLSKILTFIKSMQKKRYKDSATIIPIPTTSTKNIWIFGSKQGVSRYIRKYLIEELGIVSYYKKVKHFGDYDDDKNYGYKYVYYIENEKKFLEYCEQEDIKPFVPKNVIDIKEDSIKQLSLLEKLKMLNKDFSIDNIAFDSHYNIEIPADIEKDEFETFLTLCLYKNYKGLKFIQQKVDEINEKFYCSQQEFLLTFRPHFTYNNNQKGNILRKIGIRISNALCNMSKDKREQFLKDEGFDLGYDVKSSVPKLTLSLNKTFELYEKLLKENKLNEASFENRFVWIDDTIDIYELINKEYCKANNSEIKYDQDRRDIIKKIHMICYFSKGSDQELGKNLLFEINRKFIPQDIDKEKVNKIVGDVRRAALKVEGGKFFGSDIFYIESCVYLLTLYDLLFSNSNVDENNNVLGNVWMVYDAFYAKSSFGQNQQIYENMIKQGIKHNFGNFIEKWLI